MSVLMMAAPSKGRLQEQALAFFADAGLAILVDGRGYAAQMPAAPEVEVRLMSAGDIARAVVEGEVDLGLTGEDVLQEARRIDRPAPIVARRLGFGRADLVTAVPSAWLDVETMADLAEVCAEHRGRTGRRLRVATKYLTLTRRFFAERGLEDYRLVESPGATEGQPAAGSAEVIVDITTTGQTLAANHLRPLKDGLILHSQACLAAHKSGWTAPKLRQMRTLLDRIEARARAKAVRLVQAPGDGQAFAKAVAAAAASLGLTPAGAPGRFFCPAGAAMAAAAQLQAAAEGPVSVTAPEFVFEAANPTYEAFAAQVEAP